MPTYTVWTGTKKRLATLDWGAFPTTVTPETANCTVVQVTGSRTIVDQDWADKLLDTLGLPPEQVILVTGDAKGFDTLAKVWAAKTGAYRIVKFPALWKPQGPDAATDRGAGPKRNQAMVEFSKHMASLGCKVVVVAATVDGTKGTADMIRRCRKAKFRGVVVPYGAEAPTSHDDELAVPGEFEVVLP